jgi:poly [ADP-ribose] polymerase
MDIKPTYLILVSGDANSNKYYNCFPEGSEFRVEYGRVDSTKTIKRYLMSKWNSQIASKIRKGYVDVTDLKQDLVEEISSANPESPYKEIENAAVRAIVEKLQNLARETIQRNYTVKASAVTQDMVDAAQEIIDELANSHFTVEAFNDILLRLFTVIPRKMGNVRDYLANKPEDFAQIISKEQDLLDVMRGQIYVKPEVEPDESVEKKSQTILEELGLEMEETTDDDVAMIKFLMNESAGKFRKAWKVKNIKTQERFDKFVAENNIKDTRLLFHGSRSENFWSIIKTGLVLRPTNAIITGKMYGFGIYFAPKCQKSIGYTSLSGSYWARGNNNVAYMALFEVAYGTPYDVYNFDNKYYNLDYNKLQQFKPGANCLHAHADKGMLRNDEIIVYKEDQLTIKYLIEIGN